MVVAEAPPVADIVTAIRVAAREQPLQGHPDNQRDRIDPDIVTEQPIGGVEHDPHNPGEEHEVPRQPSPRPQIERCIQSHHYAPTSGSAIRACRAIRRSMRASGRYARPRPPSWPGTPR